MHVSLQQKGAKLLLFLGCFFVADALIAECVGVKIFSLEGTLGLIPTDVTLFGVPHLSFSLTAGVLTWPVVFIMRLISLTAAALIAYAFVVFYGVIHLSPAAWWVGVNADKGVPDMQAAFNAIFGQGMWIIAGSLTAFLVGQVVDVAVFHRIKRVTGEKHMWLRSTGSTLVSQLVDSFVVLFIAFYIGQGWPFAQVLAICLMNYTYKFLVAVASTPVIYFVHHRIDRYLGKQLSFEMRRDAMTQKRVDVAVEA